MTHVLFCGENVFFSGGFNIEA